MCRVNALGASVLHVCQSVAQDRTKGACKIRRSSEPCWEPPPPALLAGIGEFNRGKFYECHDTLEDLWMAEPRPIRQLYQGILQIAVAFYHMRARRYRPVVTLLERGSAYLQPFAPACMDLDIAHLLAGAAYCLDEVKQLGPEGLADFDHSLIPKIEMRHLLKD